MLAYKPQSLNDFQLLDQSLHDMYIRMWITRWKHWVNPTINDGFVFKAHECFSKN